MKTKLLFLLIFLNGMFVQAQDKEAICKKEFLSFEEQYNATHYEEAFTVLQALRKNCPAVNELVYIYGERLFKDKIEVLNNGEDKNAVVLDLAKLYDEYNKNFPKNDKGNEVKKAMLYYDHKLDSAAVVYTFLDKAFQKDPVHFTDAAGLDAYFSMFYDQYKTGKKGISMQDFLVRYDQVSDRVLEELKKAMSHSADLLKKKESTPLSNKEKEDLKAAQDNVQSLAIAMDNMNAYVANVTTCKELIVFYQSNFEANASNISWLKRATAVLDAQKCTSDPVFSKIVEALYTIEPSASIAFYRGIIAEKNRDTTKAIQSFEESVALQTNSKEKAQLYYKIATVYGSNNKVEARNNARKAVEANPAMGKAYLFMAQLYGESTGQCGENAFEQKAVNWLAAKTALKAGEVEPSLKVAAAKLAETYTQRAPSKAEVKAAKMKGKQITYKCWIGESITVPNL